MASQQQQQIVRQPRPPLPTSTATTTGKRKNNIGWEKDFYKNGYPQEVIVISDSPTPPPSTPSNSQQLTSSSVENLDYASSHAGVGRKRNHHEQDHLQQQQPDLKRRKWNTNTSTNHIVNQSKFLMYDRNRELLSGIKYIK